jgi:protein required for attachment to host cells
LEQVADGEPLTLIQEIDHPSGRLSNAEIDSDRAGVAFESARYGRNPMEREESAHARDVATFARQLADILMRARVEERFKRVILVADPHFLGLLRQSLDAPTLARVHRTLSKNLGHVAVYALHSHLREVLAVAPPPRHT